MVYVKVLDLKAYLWRNQRYLYLITTKRILRYEEGTVDYGILMPNQKNIKKDIVTFGYLNSD